MKRTTVAAVLVACVVAACSGDDDADVTTTSSATETTAPVTTSLPSTSTPDTSAPTSAAPATTELPDDDPGEWSIVAALAGVPIRDDGSFQVMVGDVAAVEDVLGLERPESVADEDVFEEWLLALTFPGEREGREVPVWLRMAEPLAPLNREGYAETAEQVGWSIVNVDSFVHYLPEPPGYLLELSGDFADDAPGGVPTDVDGVVSTHEGEDYATDFENRSPLDQLGRPVRFARADDRIAVGLAVDDLAAWVAGEAPTLADDVHLAAVAGALDAAGAPFAELYRTDFRFNPSVGGLTAEQVEQAMESVSVSEPFDTVGVGWAVDDAGTVRTFVAYYAVGSAEELAGQLETAYTEGVSLVAAAPIAEVLGVSELDVVADGQVVTVSYVPTRPWELPVRAIVQRDAPMVYL